MKTKKHKWIIGTMVVLIFSLNACKDDDEPLPQEMKRTYALASVSDPAINGKVTFTKVDASSTRVLIELEGTEAGDTHPAHIHANSASEGGPIVIDLSSVDGATGMSETTVTQRNDGTPINYEGLISFDGYVNVHLSPTVLSTLIAQGNIGSNQNENPGNGGNGGY
jgi:hypothetical protein